MLGNTETGIKAAIQFRREREFLKLIGDKFKASTRGVPVDRITITREEWDKLNEH